MPNLWSFIPQCVHQSVCVCDCVYSDVRGRVTTIDSVVSIHSSLC